MPGIETHTRYFRNTEHASSMVGVALEEDRWRSATAGGGRCRHTAFLSAPEPRNILQSQPVPPEVERIGPPFPEKTPAHPELAHPRSDASRDTFTGPNERAQEKSNDCSSRSKVLPRVQGKTQASAATHSPRRGRRPKHLPAHCLEMLLRVLPRWLPALMGAVMAVIVLSMGSALAADVDLAEDRDPFSPAERQWLSEHDGLIRIGITEIPPQLIRGETAGDFKGISIDYIKLMEDKLKCRFQLVYYPTWNDLIQAAKDLEIDMIFAAQETPDRSKYLLFSKPYIETPNMIVARNNIEGNLTLDNMSQLRIVCSEGSAVHEFLKIDYGHLDINPVRDEKTGLIRVSFGEADAMIVELSRASFLIEKENITNLRVAGSTGYTYQLRFASRKDWPILNRILDKGLSDITEADRNNITRKWITLGNASIFSNSKLWIALAFALGIMALVLLLILSWNQTLEAEVKQRTRELRDELLERRRMEDELRSTKERFEAMINALPDLMFQIDRKGTLHEIRTSAPRLLCASPERFLGKQIAEVLPEEACRIIMAAVDEAAEKGSHRGAAYTLPLPEGVMWFELSIAAMGEGGPGDPQFIMLARDITERKRFEADILKANKESATANETLRTLIETLSDWVWETDAQGRYTYCSPQVESCLGYTPVEMIGKTPFDFMPPDEAERVSRQFGEIGRNKSRMQRLENWNIAKDGRRILLATSGAPVLDERGNLVGYRGIETDITERRRAEERRLEYERRIHQAQKADSLARMAGAIAHNFNNMLHAIMGNLDLALMRVTRGSELQKCISEAMKASHRAAEISRLMLTYLGRTTGKNESIDLCDSLRKVHDLLKISMPANVHLRTKLPLEGPIVQGDVIHLTQILSNLISNAVEAIGDREGAITLALSVMPATEIRASRLFPLAWDPTSREYACVSVADTGVGIDAPTLDKIFDPFFSTKFTGRGLGLSVALGLVRAFEGAISVESQPGQGTTLEVLLPVFANGICGTSKG